MSLFGSESDSEIDGIAIELNGKTLLSRNKCLPPECEEGNVEYKLKLINPSESRFEHLVTQMKWRLREGNYTLISAFHSYLKLLLKRKDGEKPFMRLGSKIRDY